MTYSVGVGYTPATRAHLPLGISPAPLRDRDWAARGSELEDTLETGLIPETKQHDEDELWDGIRRSRR